MTVLGEISAIIIVAIVLIIVISIPILILIGLFLDISERIKYVTTN